MDGALMSDRMARMFGGDDERLHPSEKETASAPESANIEVGPGDDDEDEPFDDESEDEDDDYADDDDDDESDSAEDYEEGDDESALRKKLRIAKDKFSAMSEDGRLMFVRDQDDPTKMYMIARVDNIAKDAGFDDKGNEMWVGDVMFRLRGRGYSQPEKTIRNIPGDVFAKKNWAGRVEE